MEDNKPKYDPGKTYILKGNKSNPIFGAIKDSNILWFLVGGIILGIAAYSIYSKKRKS